MDSRLPQALESATFANDWPKWKQQFSVYLVANNKHEQSEKKKIGVFLWLIGDHGMDTFNTIFPDYDYLEELKTEASGSKSDDKSGDELTLAKVLKAFDDHCTPKRNLAMEAYKFHKMEQHELQHFTEFETSLRVQLKYCGYECTKCKTSYAERILRDKIIVSVYNKDLQSKLLEGQDEPLSKITELCKAFEVADINKKALNETACVEIANIKNQTESVAAVQAKCFNCGNLYNKQHRFSCPAVDKTCYCCGRKGHFKKFCKNVQKGVGSSRRGGSGYSGAVNAVNWTNDVKDKVIVRSVNKAKKCAKDRWSKCYLINNMAVNFKLDTGSDVNCIPLSIVKKANAHVLTNTMYKVVDYSSNKIPTFGDVKLSLYDIERKMSCCTSFIVVDDSFDPLLGLETCELFGLVKRIDTVAKNILPDSKNGLIERFKSQFEGLGKFPGKCKIVLKENSVPKLHYKKRIPFSLHDRLKNELKKMQIDGIISQVEHPTDWVNNIQIVEKPNGSLRICLDPKALNECIKREHFLIPKQHDILSRFSEKKIFSVLDLKNGFWQMELDHASSELTTFMTPFGRYRWNRVPFGLNCAPEIFQRRMFQIFGDIPGVEVYFDDLAIAGESVDDHDKIFIEVLKRAKENNVKFNPDKIQYRTKKIKFMGHFISNEKIEPDQCYLKAILEMPEPKNKLDVLRALGLFKYLGKFIPNLSQRTAALRELTKNNSDWEWNEKHKLEWDDLKQSITCGPVLRIFDPKKEITIQTDSSKDGLGCVLLQDGMPVAYASRTLSKSEQKWAQIEKELLAIVFACERFHYFVYGRTFTVHSDHKPLETLIKHDIDDVTARLQRMFIFLLKYSGILITYKPGKEMLVADCLSRAALKTESVSNVSQDLCVMIHSITQNACLSKENFILYKGKLNDDMNYSEIAGYVENGWPSYHKLDDFCKKFYKFKHELHFENGLLFKNHRLVIPSGLQQTICKWLHDAHLGIEKTLARGRAQFFWPGMTDAIKSIVKNCKVCEKFTRNNQKEPLQQPPRPEYPFQRVGVDIFEYAGKNFLAILDAYSGFLCCELLKDKTASHIVTVFKTVFNGFGFPTQIRCDNNPFNSAIVLKFAQECNIDIVFSSPRYPQSNGLAEKGVAIAKNLIKRCYELGNIDNFKYRVLEYNTTPVASMSLSPSQLFFGRQLKTKLPISDKLLHRNYLDEASVRCKIENKRKTQKDYYDKTSKNLPMLKAGDRVLFKKNSNQWNYGKIVKNFNNRSFIIIDGFNNHFRRNRRFIVKSENEDTKYSNEFVVNNDEYEKRFLNENSSALYHENLQEVDNFSDVNTNKEVDPIGSITDPINVSEELPNTSSNIFSTPNNSFSYSSLSPESVSHNSPEQLNSPYKTRHGRVVRPPRRYED